ncbi:MAG: GNAT family N-acetyltransferase, partial [Chloroflexota bacterium]
ILDWTIEHWGPRSPKLVAEVHEHQGEALSVLESRGFCSAGVVAVTRVYDLAQKRAEPVSLGPGFKTVTMSENGDFDSKALLYMNGFSGVDEVSELDLLTLEYSRLNPAYDPRFDFSVVTPEGRHVATCVGFVEPEFGMAEVEKICTHSQYRRLGLGEAVVRVCFSQLAECGIHTAYITGYSNEANGLYEKLGPSTRKQWFHYVLSTPPNMTASLR